MGSRRSVVGKVAACVTFGLIGLLIVGSSWTRFSVASVRAPEPLRLSSVCCADWESPALVRLNPATLRDMGRSRNLDLRWDPLAGFDARSRLIGSPDGSVVAALMVTPVNNAWVPPKHLTVQTFDPATGRLRALFHPTVPLDVSTLHLTPGGKQIYGDRSDSSGPCGWNALNTRTGHAIYSFTGDSCHAPVLYDPARQRLYLMDAMPAMMRRHSITVVLWAHDLPSGRTRGSIKLRVGQSAPPAWALSPDGRTIVVLASQDDILQLVNTATMRLMRTEQLVAPSGGSAVLGQLAVWLGIAPSVALAKDVEGLGLEMTFSPDGRRLYLTGKSAGKGLGLRVVDVRTGIIVGDTLHGKWIASVQASADGRAIYALTSDQLDRVGSSTLYRYDLDSHAITAKRRYAFEPPVILVAGQGA